MVLPFQASAPVVAGFDSFDALLAESQADSATALSIAEGRRWVAQQFYPNGATLASLRLAAGLSQSQLGERCGLAQSHVSRYESGRHEPGLGVARSMSQALGVPMETFAEAWERSRAQAEARSEQ